MLFVFAAGCGKTVTAEIAATTQIEAVSESATRIETTAEAKTAMVPVLEYPDSEDEYIESVREGRYLTNEEVVTVFDGAVIDGDNLVIFAYDLIESDIKQCTIRIFDTDEIQVWSWGERIS